MEDFYALRFKKIFEHFKGEHFSFWMICGYLFIEYVRPQSIMPALDFLPWGKLFVVFSLVGILVDKNKKWVSDPANKWMLAYLFLVTLSSYFAFFPVESWKHYMDFFNWFMIYFLIINIVRTEKRFFIFLLIFLFCVFKISVGVTKNWAMRGFSFASWGLTGPPGPYENSGELSILMLSFGPVAYQFVMFVKPCIEKMKYRFILAMPVTAAMVIVGASSRGSQIALIHQIYYIFLKGRLNLRAIFIVAAVVGAAYWLIPDEQLQRFQTAGSDKTSEQRLLYWKHGREMIANFPALGVGFFNFIPYYKQHYSYDLIFRYAELPHNIFIQVGTDIGVPGLIVYAMLIFRIFASTRKVRKLLRGNASGSFAFSLTKGLDSAFWGFLIAGQFVTVGYYPFMWIQLALVVSLRNIVENTYVSSIPGKSVVGVQRSQSLKNVPQV